MIVFRLFLFAILMFSSQIFGPGKKNPAIKCAEYAQHLVKNNILHTAIIVELTHKLNTKF